MGKRVRVPGTLRVAGGDGDEIASDVGNGITLRTWSQDGESWTSMEKDGTRLAFRVKDWLDVTRPEWATASHPWREVERIFSHDGGAATYEQASALVEALNEQSAADGY